MRRFIKIEGHTNWFLVLNKGEKLPLDFSQNMSEKILRSEVYTLHGGKKVDTSDWNRRVALACATPIDYEGLADKHGQIVIRPIGSYMYLLDSDKIIAEKFVSDEETFNVFGNELYFPNDDIFADVVICENDKTSDPDWIEYLQARFRNKTISTINFFDLRTDTEVKEIFSKAKYVTFSTTFTNMEWFKKLTRCLSDTNIVIGYTSNSSKWSEALKINKNVEVVSFEEPIFTKELKDASNETFNRIAKTDSKYDSRL